jgi:GNAT superfamily N-acetyltransferase
MSLDREVVSRGVDAVLNDPDKGRYLLAYFDDAPVGQLLITYEWSDWRAGWFWWLQSAYVADDMRRKGVFRALYDEVIQRAQSESDVLGVRLYVQEGNKKASAVYDRLQILENAYRMRALQWSQDRTHSTRG